MADATINLGLLKPSDNEIADIQVINKNMDKIDAAVIAKLLEAKGYTDDKVAQLINSAPETMNTLKALADAMGDDPNFRTTILNMLSDKANSLDLTSLLQDYMKHKSEHVKLIISDTEPIQEVNDNTFWLKHLGDTENFNFADNGVNVLNATVGTEEPNTALWFQPD